MKLKGKRMLVCSCESSMPLDGKALAKRCGAEHACQVHTQLCRAQIESFKSAVASGEQLIVGCTQEAPLFEQARAEFGPDDHGRLYQHPRARRLGRGGQGCATQNRGAARRSRPRGAADAHRHPEFGRGVPGLWPR